MIIKKYQKIEVIVIVIASSTIANIKKKINWNKTQKEDLRPSTFYSRPSTFYPRPSTFLLSTLDFLLSTLDILPSTLDPRQKPRLAISGSNK